MWVLVDDCPLPGGFSMFFGLFGRGFVLFISCPPQSIHLKLLFALCGAARYMADHVGMFHS